MSDAVLVACIAAVPPTLVALLSLRQGRTTRDRVDKVADETAQVTHEMRPNSGGSMRDAIDRIERRQEEHGKRLGQLGDELGTVRGIQADDRRADRERITEHERRYHGRP